jgi:hypothetical protein
VLIRRSFAGRHGVIVRSWSHSVESSTGYDRHSRKLYVLYVMRGEMRFRKSRLFKRDRERRIA